LDGIWLGFEFAARNRGVPGLAGLGVPVNSQIDRVGQFWHIL
jgi:hypothetical protein